MYLNDSKSESQVSPNILPYGVLLAYCSMQYPKFIINKHHVLIASYLEALEKGKITRLIINLPPRHTKTMLAAENFIAWYMGRNPTHQIIYTTYSHERAGDTGLVIKRLVNSDNHLHTFPTCEISKDSKSKNKLSTTRGGNLFSVGVGGALTGRGAHILLLDDVVKSREDAESEVSRKKIIEWFQGTAMTRLMPGGKIILLSTRWHADDIAGHILREHRKNWTLLSIPAICEDETTDLVGRKEGDALWPEWMDEKALAERKEAIGAREFNAQYQQNPFGATGSIINVDWFKKYKEAPQKFDYIYQSWDTSYKASTLHDPQVCTTWGATKTDLFLLHVWRRRAEYPTIKKEAVAMFEDFSPRIVLIENKGSGSALLQDLRNETQVPVKEVNPVMDKVSRMSGCSGLIESGRVWIPEKAPWLHDYITELAQFPVGKHDDQVDSTSQALDHFKKPRYKRSKFPLFWK